MNIIIGEKKLQYDNKIELIDEIVETIYEEVEKMGEILYSLKIDGQEVYVDFGEYLFNNIRNIEEIKVKTLTISELIESNLMTTLDYIENSREPIGILARKLQKSLGQSDIDSLSDLFEGIEWIIESFAYIDRDPNINKKMEKKEEWNLYAKEVYTLISVMPELLSAFGKQANLSVANILLEQIIPIFKDMEIRILEIVRID